MKMDLVVNLYQEKLKTNRPKLKNENIVIERLLSPNSDKLVEFVSKNFDKGWVSEIKAGIYKPNPTCLVAKLEDEIIGFACYDATALGYFGPTGVSSKYRGLNVGQNLLFETLLKMKEAGYGYGIIGGGRITSFYGKYLDIVIIDDKDNLYNRMF